MTRESSLSGDIEKDLEYMTHEQVERSCACYPSVMKPDSILTQDLNSLKI